MGRMGVFASSPWQDTQDALSACASKGANASPPWHSVQRGSISEPGSSPIVAYAWNFGNGETVEPSPDPSVTTQYDRPGVYQVLLFVTDANGLGDATKRFFPSANIS